MGGSSDVIEVAFGSGYKKRHVLCEPIEASKIDVSTVHDIERGRFEDQLIQEGDIVNFPMSDADHARNRASQIHLGMEFDGALLLPKRGPRKKRQTQVDRGGIQSVSNLGDFAARSPRPHTTLWPFRSTLEQSRRRCASPVFRSHRPRYFEKLCP